VISIRSSRSRTNASEQDPGKQKADQTESDDVDEFVPLKRSKRDR
jgi:hypothetical protein